MRCRCLENETYTYATTGFHTPAIEIHVRYRLRALHARSPYADAHIFSLPSRIHDDGSYFYKLPLRTPGSTAGRRSGPVRQFMNVHGGMGGRMGACLVEEEAIP